MHSGLSVMQVMLAQQESIAELLSLYETVSSDDEELTRQTAAYGGHCQSQAVHQEHALGKTRLKQDR